MRALRNVLEIESESVKTAIKAVQDDCHWFTSMLYNTAQTLHGPVYLQTVEFSTIFKANLYSGLVMFASELESAISPHTPEERQYLRTRSGTLYFTLFNAEILLDNVTLRMDNATVFIEKENRTSRSAVVANLDGGNLSSTSLSVWLPDGQFWKHSSETWLTFVSIR